MPLLTARSHVLRPNSWSFGGKKIDVYNEADVLGQLRMAQEARRKKLAPFDPPNGPGVLDAEYRVAIAPLGRPKYFQYLILNPKGEYWCTINALVGYAGTKEAALGMVVIKTATQEIIGKCQFSRTKATMTASDIHHGPSECVWEEGEKNNEPDHGEVTSLSKRGEIECCSILGQSRSEELGGAVLRHQIVCKTKLIAVAYPEGMWTFKPSQIWNRLVNDTIRLLDYSEYFAGGIADAESERSFLIALAVSVTLHRRILHGGNPP
jgi:hypothetical protein